MNLNSNLVGVASPRAGQKQISQFIQKFIGFYLWLGQEQHPRHSRVSSRPNLVRIHTKNDSALNPSTFQEKAAAGS
jgi:hypothetical protein